MKTRSQTKKESEHEPYLLRLGLCTSMGWQGFKLIDVEREWRRLNGQPVGEPSGLVPRETFEAALRPGMRIEDLEVYPCGNYSLGMEIQGNGDVWGDLQRAVHKALTTPEVLVTSTRGGGLRRSMREDLDLSRTTQLELRLGALSPEGKAYLRDLTKERLAHVLAAIYILADADEAVRILDVSALPDKRLTLHVATRKDKDGKLLIDERLSGWRKTFRQVMAMTELKDGMLLWTKREAGKLIGLFS